MTGQTIANYTFAEILGKGGMATVYLATKKNLDSTVAIKVLNQEFVYNPAIRNRFLAEAKKMFGMDHPNILKVTDFIEEGQLVAFVMEYIDGQTLKQFLSTKEKLGFMEIKNIILQVASALSYVHEEKMVHRDIKPSNIMISSKGRIKLLDFGIAKDIEGTADTTRTDQSMGTPMYMSPEQIISAREVKPSSDIYSLGVVLWQMITNRKPYDAPSMSNFEIGNNIVNIPLPVTNSPWDRIISKATQKKENERYPSMESFLKDLEVVTDEEITVIETKQRPAAIVKVVKPKNNNLKYLIGIATVLAAAIIIVVLVQQKEKTNAPLEQSSVTEVPFGSYPMASIRLLMPDDLRSLSPYNIRIMRNEIYARYGLIFQNQEMHNYFSTQPWYKPRYHDVKDSLTEIEIKNLQFIKSYEGQ